MATVKEKLKQMNSYLYRTYDILATDAAIMFILSHTGTVSTKADKYLAPR